MLGEIMPVPVVDMTFQKDDKIIRDSVAGITGAVHQATWNATNGFIFTGDIKEYIEVPVPGPMSNLLTEIWMIPDLKRMSFSETGKLFLYGILQGPDGSGYASGYRLTCYKVKTENPRIVRLVVGLQMNFGEKSPRSMLTAIDLDENHNMPICLSVFYDHRAIRLQVGDKIEIALESRDIHWDKSMPALVGLAQRPFCGMIQRVRFSSVRK